MTDGWVLVPREPTEAMQNEGVNAAADQFGWSDEGQIKTVWAAMIAAAPPVDGWQAIDTAPRDGTLILCFYPDRHSHDRYSLRYWATGDWGVRTEGWSDQYRQLRKTDPTAWMPLSQPLNNERAE
jgi:hypothetical protein